MTSQPNRRASHARKIFAGAVLAACVASTAARADDAPPSILDQIPQFAQIDAFKKQLADKGVALQLNYITDIQGNPTGGQQQGAAYAGRLELAVDADLEKLLGLQGLAFHANGYWITGVGLTTATLGNDMTASGIAALPTVRLFELWVEQKLLNDKVAVRVGQLAADSEFTLSKYGALFVNSTFGWSAFTGTNLPNGGPAYPLATPGVRVKIGGVDDPFNILLAVYNGDPAGPGLGNPQKRDAYGTNFTLDGPPLAIQEVQYRYNQDPKSGGLAGTIKIGSYQHFGNFSDLRYDVNGLPIGVTGADAGEWRGNFGLYGVIDQQVYKLASDPTKGIGVFARLMGAPADRNPFDFYAEGGVNFSGFVPGRSDDVFGVAFAYARISNALRGYDYDAGVYPVQDYEAVIEATYQYQLMPGWSLQPDIQYILHPGANVVDLNGQPAKNALVIGLRTSMSF